MYYILKCFDPAEGYIARIEYKKDNPFRFWNRGERFAKPPPTPIPARLISDDQTILAELWETPLPMMSLRLHRTLCSLGVGNLDVYPVAFTDSRSEASIEGYVAFNLIGVIAAADLTKTHFAADSPERMISADIDHLELDAARIGGARMFRLAESVGAIIVDQQIKDGLEADGFDSLTFMQPEQWVG